MIANRYKLECIRDELMCMIELSQSYNPYDDPHIEHFYRTLSHTIYGMVKWKIIDIDVFALNVKSMLPFYMEIVVWLEDIESLDVRILLSHHSYILDGWRHIIGGRRRMSYHSIFANNCMQNFI